MKLTIPQATKPLTGSISVPGDKSLAHRALLFAAIADGTSHISNYPDSGVTRSMRKALEALGVKNNLSHDGVLTLEGNGLNPFPCMPGTVAYCGNSATTIRLLAGVLAGTGTVAVLDGSEGLRKRPMSRIVDPLRMMGVDVLANEKGCAPLTFGSLPESGLNAIKYDLPVASAQVKSCIILAALGAKGETLITEPGPSRDHTERMLRAMGVDIKSDNLSVRVKPCRHLSPITGVLPNDISSAAFLFAAAAIVPGSDITVTGIGLNYTRTGILDILSQMGIEIEVLNERTEFGEPVGDVRVRNTGKLHGIEIDGDLVVRAIDEFPAVAVVAAFAEGDTVARGAMELRFKESDRITAIVTQLKALGVEAEESEDGFRVRGGTIKGGVAHANGDHRLAMSMSLAGLRVPVSVEGAEILTESFPDFVDAVKALSV
jgi:3-phosphoshikimate 1-carboxyvinyltransferase